MEGAERGAAADEEGAVSIAVASAVETVRAAGGRIDAEDVAWLAAALSATAAPGEFRIGAEFGGHELAMLDFDPAAAGPLRRLGDAIGTRPAPDLAVALAVTGSAAQGCFQTYPADTDYFERVHLLAPTREGALGRLADVVRATVERVEALPGFALEEVWFGTLPPSLAVAQEHRIGSALAWRRAEVAAGVVELRPADGGVGGRVTWAEAATDPGLIKFDWFVSTGAYGGPKRVSKVIDPTWHDPQGCVVSLDGAIDGDFQQVYLASKAAGLAWGLVGGGRPGEGDAGDRAAYEAAMERDVVAYARRHPSDFCKVAKRLYNLCRTTARFPEAVFVRDLLGDGPARLAQLRASLEVAAVGCGDLGAGNGMMIIAGVIADLRGEMGDDATGVGLVDACHGALQSQGDGRLRGALGALDAHLRERVNRGFRDRLLGHRPTATLLADLERRYPVCPVDGFSSVGLPAAGMDRGGDA